MNTKAVEVEDDEIEIEEELETEEEELDEEVSEEETDEEGEESEEEGESEDDDLVVSIDGESPPQDDEDDKAAPHWVKELRKTNRETQKENRQLKAKLDELTGATKVAELGKKPTLEDCDYDTDAYDRKLQDYYERKREHDKQQEEVRAEQKRQEREWQDNIDAYESKKTSLKVKDFDEAESFVLDTFSQTQQGMIISGAEDPALLVYALGKNQKKAQEFASIKDPVKFAFAVAKLETKLKVTNRKVTTKPEKTVRGSGKATSGAVDSQLERLRAEASESGDFTKLNAYKKKLKAKGK